MTNETLLISAILNEGDAYLAKDLGIRSEHFNAYQREYNWIIQQYQQYRTCPTEAEFLVTFPSFPHDRTSYNAAGAAHMVKRAWGERDMRRRLLEASRALEQKEVEEAFQVFEDCRLEVTTAKPDNLLVDHQFLDDYEGSHEPRIAVPWESLQARTYGIGPGELWYFAARQGHGKSSFLLDMAVQAAMDGHSVVVYSLEMTKRQTQIRVHSMLAHQLGIKPDMHAMLHRNWPSADYKYLLQQIEELVPGTISVHEVSMGMVTPAVVDTNAQHYDMSIIDYVGLMRNDEGLPAIKDYRIIAEISNSLKSIALGKGHAIIAASQINRDGVSAHWRPPALHTLAQSDHLGNDGDVVITMKRYAKGAAVCSLEKNRHGQSDVVFFTNYAANIGDFDEITRDAADEIKYADEDA